MKVRRMMLAGREITGHVVEDQDDLPAFAEWAKRHREFGFDTETTGLDVFQPGFLCRTAQFSAGTTAWLLPVERHPRFAWYAAQTLRWARRLYIHNASFDLQVVDRHLGVPLEELWPKTVDTSIISRLVDSRSRKEGGTGHSLEDLVEAYIDPAAARDIKGSVTRQAKELRVKKAEYFKKVPLEDEIFQMYALMDPVLAWVLAKVLEPKVPDTARHLIPYEHTLARICSQITRQGFLLDKEYTSELVQRLRADEREWLDIIRNEVARVGLDQAEFNPNSTDQVSKVLREFGWEEFRKTPTGKDKVDEDLLAELDGKGWLFAKALRHYKRSIKWAATWPEAFLAEADENGRCHAWINTLQARTGRMSITGIPAQTLPSGEWMVRRCFLADEGHVMASVDYAAQELRMAAALSGDERMRQAFVNGEDLHQITADAAGVSRKVGKMANFLTCYGGGWKALVQQAKVAPEVAKKVIEGFNATYPAVPRLAERLAREAMRDGYITTITGRRLYVDPGRAYSAINYAIQSASRDVTAWGLIKCDQAGLTPYLRLPIHDEVLASLPAGQAEEMAAEIGRCLKTTIRGVVFETEPEVGGRSWGSLYGAEY